MLRSVSLVGDWREIASGLPEGWADARLRLTIEDESQAARAAALLGPLNPARRRHELRFYVARQGRGGSSAQLVERLLARIDAERVRGRLELVGTGEAEPPPAPTQHPTLAGTWDADLAALPPDWSDVYAEIELRSTDYIERAALLCSPLNPRRDGGKPALRFRCARSFGYGAAPEMVRRCFERCDAEGIRGHVHVLRVLCDTKPVHTQGPVWHIAGRTV
jgi:hypothetical protein